MTTARGRRTKPVPRKQPAPRKPDDEWARLVVSGDVLRARRQKKNLTLRKLAEYCGHSSHTHLLRLEQGKTVTTSIRTAVIVEGLLDVSTPFFARMSAKPLGRAA